MELNTLESKWNMLVPEGTGSFKSFRISADCIPDLYIGIDTAAIRCLILKLPSSHTVDFQSVIRQNLSVELFRDTSWILLKLSDETFSDLFNDLILSIYNKIKAVTDVKEYVSVFIETFYKWSEFFDDRYAERLSEETIKGILGELLFLREVIQERDAAYINDVLQSWKGMYDTGHDFIFSDHNVEVKTKDIDHIDIHISSEYQLEPEREKELKLVVVNVQNDPAGITLREAVSLIRQLVIERLGDFSIVLSSLAQKGLTTMNLPEYDDFRYTPVNMVTYDCMHVDFPKIIRTGIPDLINTVKYHIRISALDTFITDQKQI